MQTTKKRLLDQIRRLRQQFAQSPGGGLSDVLSVRELEQVVERFAGAYRDRIYAPLTTLWLFMGQALSADGACQDAGCPTLE